MCFPKAGYRSSCVFLPLLYKLLYKLIILCNSQSQIQSSKFQRNGAKIIVPLICFLCFWGDEIVFQPRIYQMFVAFSRMYPGANIEQYNCLSQLHFAFGPLQKCGLEKHVHVLPCGVYHSILAAALKSSPLLCIFHS